MPQCLKLEFRIVKCAYLLFGQILCYFSTALFHTEGFEASSLKIVHQLFSHLLQYQPIWYAQQLFSISQVQSMIPIVFELTREP